MTDPAPEFDALMKDFENYLGEEMPLPAFRIAQSYIAGLRNMARPALPAPEPPTASLRPVRPSGDAEALARRFHETYERLAPQFNYDTRPDSAVPWANVPENNRALMVAVAAEILRGAALPAEHAPPEPEWDHPPKCPKCNALMWGEGVSEIGKKRQYCRTCGFTREADSGAALPAAHAPLEPHLEREGNEIRAVGFGSGPLAPNFIPSHLSKGVSSPSPQSVIDEALSVDGVNEDDAPEHFGNEAAHAWVCGYEAGQESVQIVLRGARPPLAGSGDENRLELCAANIVFESRPVLCARPRGHAGDHLSGTGVGWT